MGKLLLLVLAEDRFVGRIRLVLGMKLLGQVTRKGPTEGRDIAVSVDRRRIVLRRRRLAGQRARARGGFRTYTLRADGSLPAGALVSYAAKASIAAAQRASSAARSDARPHPLTHPLRSMNPSDLAQRVECGAGRHVEAARGASAVVEDD